jgi:hypothetical protein
MNFTVTKDRSECSNRASDDAEIAGGESHAARQPEDAA